VTRNVFLTLSISLAALAAAGGCSSSRPVALRYDIPAAVPLPAGVRKISLARREDAKDPGGEIAWNARAAQAIAEKLPEVSQGRYQLAGSHAGRVVQTGQQAPAVARSTGAEAVAVVDATVTTSEKRKPLTRLDRQGNLQTRTVLHKQVQVALSVELLDAASGATLASVLLRRAYDSDLPRKSLARVKPGADVDAIAAVLLRDAADDFVRRITPREVSVKVPLAEGDNPAMERGNRLAMAGEYLAAAEQYRLHLRDEPEDAGAWGNLGVVLEGAADFPAALDAYSRAFELSEDIDYRQGLARMRSLVLEE
jgi:tetratricopeptide (TPR) repeat protein